MPRLDVVSTPRCDIDFVVTEHGIADLRGATDAARAAALIAVAAPEHRDALAGDLTGARTRSTRFGIAPMTRSIRVHGRNRARRLAAVLVVILGLGVIAGCVPSPSDGSPGSPGVPVIGLSRLTPEQLVAYYNSRSHPPYRAQDVSLEDLARMFVDEGNRYQVRGDIAFAQAIIETSWFNYPDCDGCLLHPDSHNYAGIGACDTCGNGHGFSTPLAGVRAQIQLLRNMADPGSLTGTIPDPPVPELWGLDPSAAAWTFDHYHFKGKAQLWNDMTGVWASSPEYASTILGVYNQMLINSGLPGQCPADGLTFGPLVAAGPCPLSIRQPGRAMATTFSDGLYVVNGNGNVLTYGGAPYYGSPTFGSDWARDIAVMPGGDGYVVLSADGHLYRYGSAALPANWGRSPSRRGSGAPTWRGRSRSRPTARAS